jgi:hypothetical protein
VWGNIVGPGRFGRIHREVAADRHQREVGLEALADQAHVAEGRGVACVVDAKAVLQFDDQADRLAARVCFVLA